MVPKWISSSTGINQTHFANVAANKFISEQIKWMLALFGKQEKKHWCWIGQFATMEILKLNIAATFTFRNYSLIA